MLVNMSDVWEENVDMDTEGNYIKTPLQTNPPKDLISLSKEQLQSLAEYDQFFSILV